MPERLSPRPQRSTPRALPEVGSRLGLASAGLPSIQVRGVTLDSGDVRPGDLFAALPGARTHGARFAAEAARRGAVAVLTDPAGTEAAATAGVPVLAVPDPRARLGALAAWIYGDPGADLLLVGITGTNGKTTTAYLLDAVLRRAGHRTGLIGTVETRVGDEVLPSVRTTPEAPELQALLAVMAERGVTAVTMEVSSHALALGRVDGTVFDVAAFTNLAADHLDFHGDMAGYFAVKATLFTRERSRSAVVCVDDPWGRRLAAEAEVPVTTLATRPGNDGTDADWSVVDREALPTGPGVAFTLASRDGTRLPATSLLAGAVNVANAALAAVTGLRVGVAPDVVAAALAAAPGVPGRMERVAAPVGGPLAVVDYAHTADAVAAAAAALRESVTGRLVVVLGAGGDRDTGKRSPMGAAAAQQADLVVVTDDNPRSEDPAAIRAAVLTGAREVARARGTSVLEVGDRRQAIRRAVRGLTASDAVLVAGKGHEPGQDVGGVVTPFDDRAVLREALRRERDLQVPP